MTASSNPLKNAMLEVHDRFHKPTKSSSSQIPKVQKTPSKGGKFKTPTDKLIDISEESKNNEIINTNALPKINNQNTPNISSTPSTPYNKIPSTPSTPSMYNVSLKSSTSQFQTGQKPQERKIAEGKLMYDIIKYLKEHAEQELSAQELYTATNIDIKSNIELQKALQQNIKIRFEDEKYSYKPKYEIKSKEECF